MEFKNPNHDPNEPVWLSKWRDKQAELFEQAKRRGLIKEKTEEELKLENMSAEDRELMKWLEASKKAEQDAE